MHSLPVHQFGARPSPYLPACESLRNLTFPASITNIGENNFDYLNNLTGIYFEGNIPVDAVNLLFVSSATIYYLPGTDGWDDFALSTGKQIELWLPQMQTTDASFGVHIHQFGFNINWASDQTVVVETCANFANRTWQPLQTITLTNGTAYFSDPLWTNYASRFYRLRSP